MSDTSIGARDGHTDGEALTEAIPVAAGTPPPLTGFAAGVTGAALLVAGVWGLHVLSPAGGPTLSVGSVVLLLAAFTALGKGITLIQRALAPITAAAFIAVSVFPPLIRALAAVIVGAAGLWWVMRGQAASWWSIATGAPSGWTLISAVVQVTVIAAAGALLFGGAKRLVAPLISNSGTRRHGVTQAERRDWWASWWSSRPGLGVMLLAGAAAVVTLSGYIVPRVSRWLLGADAMAALAAIVVILIAGLLANTWWWGALSGWWTWAHRPHTPGGGATPMGQIYAGAGVVALVWFSATAFGMAVPDSYTGPGAVPRARADCPPDCGGGLSGGPGDNGSQFQPPQMPQPPSQYQGGANSGYPGPDQSNGISIYNPEGQGAPPGQGSSPQYPQQGQPGPPANGVQPPNYDAPLPSQAPAPQQGPSAPSQPAQAPQQPAQQAPIQQQGPQQPVQQSPQQPPSQLQPGQENQPSQQGQPGHQQPQNPPNQQNAQQVQQQPQNQKPTAPKKDPNSPIDPTDLAAAATRRGSQQAGQQTAQTASRQAAQRSAEAVQQAAKTGEQTAEKVGEKGAESPNTAAGLAQGAIKSGQAAGAQTEGVARGIENAGTKGAKYGYEVSEDLLKGAETAGNFAKRAGLAGDALSAVVDLAAGKPPVEAVSKAVGSAVGGYAGGALGAALGALTGPLAPVAIPALATLGSVGGSLIGDIIGEKVAPAVSSAISAVSSWFG